MSWDYEERRQFVRAAFPCELSVHTAVENTIYTQTENISAGGIRVLIEKRIPPASIIKVTLYKIRETPIICVGRVIWVFTRNHPQNKNLTLFDIGIEFYEIAEEEILEIKNLIASLISAKKFASE